VRGKGRQSLALPQRTEARTAISAQETDRCRQSDSVLQGLSATGGATR
jgi:hypothetical protein